MRRVHVLAVAGAAVLLASCSSQPNDLRDNRYYENAEQPAPTPPSPSAALGPMAAAAVPSTPPKLRDLTTVAVTAADLSAEGVQPSGAPARTVLTALPDCNVVLSDAKAGYQTAWMYPTGAILRQYLGEFDGDAGAVAESVTEKLTCGRYKADGADVTVRTPVTAPDGQVSWCAVGGKQSSCTVVKSDGTLLSVIVVSASTEAKAKQAVTRIAPLAATALARTS